MTYSTGDLFPFEPDWSDGVIERMEWMTDIMRANNGDEQRVGVRDQPRVSLSVRYLLQRNDAAFLRNLAWRRSFYYFYLPFWPHRNVVTSTAGSGSTTIQTPGLELSVTTGSYVAFMGADGRQVEVKQVSSASTNNIVLTSAITNDWPARTTIVPCARGHLDNDFQLSLTQVTPNVTRAETQFLFDPRANPLLMPQGTPDFIYAGHELWVHEPNWINDIPLDTRHFTQLIDRRVGTFRENSYGLMTWMLPEQVMQGSWFLKGREAIDKFRQFLARRHGRMNTFWTPSWGWDFELVSPIGPADTVITVKYNYTAYTPAPGRQHIMIRSKSGVYWPCEVDNITDNGDGTSAVTIGAALGSALAVANVDRIMWLHCARLASDTVELRWEHTQFAEARMSLSFMTDRGTVA